MQRSVQISVSFSKAFCGSKKPAPDSEGRRGWKRKEHKGKLAPFAW
uniref:Uncharacterized protein n=1 Tax=Bacillus subtilis subsp. natto TaxID=86029 RepID=E9RJ20_BACNA|nr:hypothetical protein [Bacillus subtilis subsp. natto]